MNLVANIIFVVVLFYNVYCDQLVNINSKHHFPLVDKNYLIQNIYFNRLTYFKFYPKLGNCYEVYNKTERVTSSICMRKVNIEKQACIEWISKEKRCLGLKTPSNETIEFRCSNGTFFDNYVSCFNVYKPGRPIEKVCQRMFDDNSVGITTSDNFTILFDSLLCRSSMSIEERKIYSNFVENFTFNPDIRSCYKIYRPDQKVTPYTCLEKDVQESCVQKLPLHDSCVGLITQNNEVIILDCNNTNWIPPNRNCFKIYDNEKNIHISCLEKLEERCVGISTPSNLTVLFECYFCTKPHIKNTLYNATKQKLYRDFVKVYMENEYNGKNVYVDKIQFNVFHENEYIEPPRCEDTIHSVAYGYWLQNTSCYALTLKNNETVILQCVENNNELEHGCYTVVSPTGQNQKVCTTVLDELCVGIVTPLNMTVAFTCYPLYNCEESTRSDIQKQPPYEELYELHSIEYQPQDCYKVYDTEEKINSYNCIKNEYSENYSCSDWIPWKENCLGVKTPRNETVELSCGDKNISLYHSFTESNICFNVYSPVNDVEKTCLKRFGNNNVGITTPKNYSILFKSNICNNISTEKKQKIFLENFVLDLNLRSCFKIFDQDQVINSYTCSDREIYDTCVYRLPEVPNCEAITTQNNETIILNCKNDYNENYTGCFKLYTSDNKTVTSCQKELENGCIGITTPSNLIILFGCYNCISPETNQFVSYNDLYKKENRDFVKTKISEYETGNYRFQDGMVYEIFAEDDNFRMYHGKKEIYIVHPLLGHNNCLGITNKNLETIIFECPNTKFEKTGCFEIFGPKYGPHKNIVGEKKMGTICVKILNERCVGIVTPNNWTLPLNCNELNEDIEFDLEEPQEGSTYRFISDSIPLTKPIRMK